MYLCEIRVLLLSSDYSLLIVYLVTLPIFNYLLFMNSLSRPSISFEINLYLARISSR